MFAAYVGVVIGTAVLNAAAAAADFSRARFVLANSAELGVAEGWLPLLGALKAAGAAGLLIGLLWARPVGTAADPERLARLDLKIPGAEDTPRDSGARPAAPDAPG